MKDLKKDWTHKLVKITDIRKLSKLYIFTIDEDPNSLKPILKLLDGIPLFVNKDIFENRLKSYFLKDIQDISREDILKIAWNMYITKGYYIKIINAETRITEQDPEKYYVSFLEIEGPLGSFQSILKDHKNIKEND